MVVLRLFFFLLELHGFVAGEGVEVDAAAAAVLLLLHRGHGDLGGL